MKKWKLFLFGILGMLLLFFCTRDMSTGHLDVDLLRHMKKRYQKEFIIIYGLTVDYGVGSSFGASLILKEDSETIKAVDDYYWISGHVGYEGIKNDDYGRILLNESANNFYTPKLKELFGENIIVAFNVDFDMWEEHKEKDFDFQKEMERKRRLYKEFPDKNHPPLKANIYIFGKVENDKEKEVYREKIYNFIEYMKETKNFEYAEINFRIIDEKILTDDNIFTDIKESANKIIKEANNNIIDEAEKLNKNNKILCELSQNILNKDMKSIIEKLPKGKLLDKTLKKYNADLLISNIVSPKRAMNNITGRMYPNNYESKENILFNGEEPKYPDETVRELGAGNTYYITETKNGMKNGNSTRYDEEGNILWTGTFKNNKLHGEYRGYTSKGILIEEGRYVNGLQEGELKIYDSDGKISEERLYKNGVLNGKLRKYYDDGNIDQEETYKNGLLDGEYKDYYGNGNIFVSAHYKNGKLDGTYKHLSYSGVLLKKEEYKDGKLHGQRIEYYEKNGQIYKIEEYKNGKFDGRNIEYDDEGNIHKIEEYKNGLRHGVHKLFDKKTLVFEANFKEDKHDGIYRDYYYSNGNLNIERLYKDGKSLYEKEYDEAGKLVKEKIYSEAGQLIEEKIYN